MAEITLKYAVFRSHIQADRKLMRLYDTMADANDAARKFAGEEPNNCNPYGPSYPYYYEVTPVYTPVQQDRNKLY